MRAVAEAGSVERFAKAVIINYLLGAPDAHAKNYSLLLVGGLVRLAPLYDLASGLTADRDGRLRYPEAAMSIGGERRFGDVHGMHWDRCATRLGLPTELMRSWVNELAAAAPDAVQDAAASVPPSARDRGQLSVLTARVARLSKLTAAALTDVRPGTRATPTGSELLASIPRKHGS